MKKNDKADAGRVALGAVSGSTRGDVRGVIEFTGLYLPALGLA